MSKKIAFVFPGQGSQAVGMLAELATAFPQVQETFVTASKVLGYDLWELVQQGPEEKLNQTVYTQPALLTAGVAIWRIWQGQGGLKPSLLAGHSLGEYTALVCAEALDFADAVSLVADRGRFMQLAYPQAGAMVAIVGLDDVAIQDVCQRAAMGQVLVPANYNSIGQTVLAGEMLAAQRAVDLAKAAGAKIVKLLPVSVPSHCELMRPAADALAERLSQVTFHQPQVPVINNVDVKCYIESAEIRDALVRQLYSPVRWVETIQSLVQADVACILECGPGKVLTNLIKRITDQVVVSYLGTVTNLQQNL